MRIAQTADACVVVLATTSGEGSDRSSLALPSAETELARAVGAVQRNCVAVVVAPGAVLMDWAGAFSAVLVLFLPGQEEGNAVADVLFGAEEPCGRLPLTFPNIDNEMQFSAAQFPGIDHVANYSEGLLLGYRWYHAHAVRPRFPFGHGLGFGDFRYGALQVDVTAGGLQV